MNNNFLRKIGLVVSIIIIVTSVISFFVCDDRFFTYLYFIVGFVYLMLNLFVFKNKK